MKADRSGTWTEQKMYKMGYQTFAWPVILQLHQEPFATSTKKGR